MNVTCPVCGGSGRRSLDPSSAGTFDYTATTLHCNACGGCGYQDDAPLLHYDPATGRIAPLVPDPRIAELEAQNTRLRERLARLVAAAKPAAETVWSTNPSVRYYALADAFRDETGHWPPGRDRPMAMGGHDEEAAANAWRDWLQTRAQRVADELRAAIAEAKGP